MMKGIRLFIVFLWMMAMEIVLLIHCAQAQNVAGQIVKCHCICGDKLPPCGDQECREYCYRGQYNNAGGSPSDFRLLLIQSALTIIPTLFKTDPGRQWQELEAQRLELERIAIENKRQQRIKDSLAQVLYERLMALYKQLPGAQTLSSKSLPGSQSLQLKTLDQNQTLTGFKNFDGDNSGYMYKGIEVGPKQLLRDTSWSSRLGETDVQLLVNPDNDPVIINIGKTNDFLTQNMRNEELKDQATKPAGPREAEKPKYQPGECQAFRDKYNGFMRERAKLQQTMNLTQQELNEWTKSNKKALANAFADGAEFFVGKLLEHLETTRKSSSEVIKYLVRNEEKLRARGIDVDTYKHLYYAKIINYDAARFSKWGFKGLDYAKMIRDESQIVMQLIAENNQDVAALLNDPRFKQYLNDEAEGDAAKFLLREASEIFQKEASEMTKWFTAVFCTSIKKEIPLIAIADLSINEIYNGLDWYYSRNLIIQNRGVKGNEIHAAEILQHRIDETAELLKGCL